MFPPGSDFIALDEVSHVIHSTKPDVPGAAAAFGSAVDEDSSGFDWNELGGEYLARSWSLFMQPQFRASWTLVYSQPKSEILAALYRFRYTFFLVAVLTLLIAMWVSIRQIRKRRVPGGYP